MSKDKRCEICRKIIKSSEFCWVTTIEAEGECYYHNTCFDDMFYDAIWKYNPKFAEEAGYEPLERGKYIE